MSSEVERRAHDDLAARFLAAFEGGGFGGCCTPDVQYEDPLLIEPLAGVAALDSHAERLRQAAPDARIERASEVLRSARHVCIPWRLTGNHSGDLGVLPATGRTLDVHGLHYIELSDGAVRRARGFFDLYDASVQLGLLPERGGLGEAALLLLRGFGLRR